MGDVQKVISAKVNEIGKDGPFPPGLVLLQPDADALPARCFENVWKVVAAKGGRTIYGWTFHHRLVEGIDGPGYLYLTHHAVWQRPSDGALVDVTPYPNLKHRPLPGKGDNLFLVDMDARPVRRAEVIAPLPLRFFPLSANARLVEYVAQLSRKEQAEYARIFTEEFTR